MTHIRSVSYLETGGNGPLGTVVTKDGSLGNMASANKVVINVLLPRHSVEKEMKMKERVKVEFCVVPAPPIIIIVVLNIIKVRDDATTLRPPPFRSLLVE